MNDMPNEEQMRRYFSMLGKGGKARFAKMTPAERKAFNTKASKAAAKARSKKKKAKKKEKG